MDLKSMQSDWIGLEAFVKKKKFKNMLFSVVMAPKRHRSKRNDINTGRHQRVNLRIKTHTTKNIINNKLLLWQRGVHGFRTLVNIHSYKRSAVFQTAVQPITDSLVKCNRLYGKTMFTVHT